jgi:excisionase family DNA binding protein
MSETQTLDSAARGTTATPDTTNGTYTVADLARLLQCSTRHVWRLIDLGRVPGVLRLGRLVRISKPIADAWLAAGCPADSR